jgi:phenylacetate-CoA ligase
MGARALWAMGCRPGDFVVNCFNYSLVFTTLRRRACPLIRLRTHDTVRVLTDRCACGRTSFRFHVLGRSDDMFIVKGMNIFPLTVQESLLLLRPEVTGEFFIVLDSAPPINYSP